MDQYVVVSVNDNRPDATVRVYGIYDTAEDAQVRADALYNSYANNRMRRYVVVLVEV